MAVVGGPPFGVPFLGLHHLRIDLVTGLKNVHSIPFKSY